MAGTFRLETGSQCPRQATRAEFLDQLKRLSKPDSMRFDPGKLRVLIMEQLREVG